MNEPDVARDEALLNFAQSTRDTLTSLANLVEIHEQRIDALERLCHSFGEWTKKAQDLLLQLSDQVTELETRLENLE